MGSNVFPMATDDSGVETAPQEDDLISWKRKERWIRLPPDWIDLWNYKLKWWLNGNLFPPASSIFVVVVSLSLSPPAILLRISEFSNRIMFDLNSVCGAIVGWIFRAADFRSEIESCRFDGASWRRTVEMCDLIPLEMMWGRDGGVGGNVLKLNQSKRSSSRMQLIAEIRLIRLIWCGLRRSRHLLFLLFSPLFYIFLVSFWFSISSPRGLLPLWVAGNHRESLRIPPESRQNPARIWKKKPTMGSKWTGGKLVSTPRILTGC